MFAEVSKIIDDKQTNNEVEVNILETPPNIIWFVFEYKDYFDIIDFWNNDKASFKTRSCFGRILPLEFNLKEIFNEVNNCNISEEDWSYNSHRSAILVDIKYRLTYLIGYHAHHYISFVRDGKKWYECEDSATSLLGDSTALFDHLEKHKIIPYLVFYQKWGDEDEHIKSSNSHNIKSQQITIQFNERDIKNKNISSEEKFNF